MRRRWSTAPPLFDELLKLGYDRSYPSVPGQRDTAGVRELPHSTLVQIPGQAQAAQVTAPELVADALVRHHPVTTSWGRSWTRRLAGWGMPSLDEGHPGPASAAER